MFNFTPITQDFEPKGVHSTKLFYVKNGGNEPIAVQITVAKRENDINGVETRDENLGEENFFVYPPQMVIPPRREQVIRVQWLGEPEVEIEQAYRIIVEEVPVNLKAKTPEMSKDSEEVVTGVDFIFTYEGALYVAHKEFEPDVVLISSKYLSENGAEYLEIIFENQGKRHLVMQDLEGVAFTSLGEEVKIPKEAFKGSPNILAGQKRRYLIPWPEGLRKGEVNFDYTYFGKKQ